MSGLCDVTASPASFPFIQPKGAIVNWAGSVKVLVAQGAMDGQFVVRNRLERSFQVGYWSIMRSSLCRGKSSSTVTPR